MSTSKRTEVSRIYLRFKKWNIEAFFIFVPRSASRLYLGELGSLAVVAAREATIGESCFFCPQPQFGGFSPPTPSHRCSGFRTLEALFSTSHRHIPPTRTHRTTSDNDDAEAEP